MIKPTKRKAFNFLRSYFDVLNELKEDSDKLQFLISIINKQFLNEDPKDLSFIANLCYESQRHSVESSVKGWERASKDTLLTTPPTPLPTTPPTPKKEEEEEEEEKEKEELIILTPAKAETKIDFNKLRLFINETTGRNFKVINKSIQGKYLSRLKEGYTNKDIQTAIVNSVKAKNHIETKNKYLTPEFFSRPDKIDMYSDVSNKESSLSIKERIAHIKTKPSSL